MEGNVPQDVQGRIRFDNICFNYPTRPDIPVLRNFNIVIEPGTYVALVGASGCGKSTAIQLVERFYDPQAGTIYVRDLFPPSDILLSFLPSSLMISPYRA